MRGGGHFRSPGWALVAILGGTFMLLVDVTIVQVALPSIERDLHAGFAGLQWVIDAYTLTLSALLLSAGTLADRFSRKSVFLGGLAVFTVSSLGCGLAGSPLVLDLARAVQGIGGAAMFTTSLALIGQEFEGHMRHRAIALWGATIGGAVAVGPLLGGAITEFLSWHWIFYVNAPVGLAVFAIAARAVTRRGDPHAVHADVAGLVTFSGALFLLVFGLVRGNTAGWGSGTTLAVFAGAVVLLAAFVVVEARQARPMFDLSLLRKPAFTGLSVGTFAIGAGMFALFPYLTLYLQNILGYSPLQGGLRLLPITALIFVVPVVSRPLAARVPAGTLLAAGLGLVLVGLVLMHGVDAQSRWTALLPGMVVCGVGIGFSNPAIGTLALAVVPPQRAGMASGISQTLRIGGLTTGVAGLGALLQHRVATRVDELLPAAPHGLASALASGGTRAATALVAPADRAAVAAASRSAFASGLDLTLLACAAALAAGALVVALFVRPALVARASAPDAPVEAEPILE